MTTAESGEDSSILLSHFVAEATAAADAMAHQLGLPIAYQHVQEALEEVCGVDRPEYLLCLRLTRDQIIDRLASYPFPRLFPEVVADIGIEEGLTASHLTAITTQRKRAQRLSASKKDSHVQFVIVPLLTLGAQRLSASKKDSHSWIALPAAGRCRAQRLSASKKDSRRNARRQSQPVAVLNAYRHRRRTHPIRRPAEAA